MEIEETLTFQDLQKVFKFSSQLAAQHLGVNHSRLKRACRILNVNRWPHRKLSSLDFVREAMMDNKKTTPAQKEAFHLKIDQEYQRVLDDPDHDLSSEVCSLRHSLWKAKHCSKRKETRCVGGTGPGMGNRADYGMRGHADEDEEDDEGEMFTEDSSETDSDERVTGRKPQPRKPCKKPVTARPAGAAGARARQQQQGGGDSPQSYPNSPQHHPLLQAANPLRLDELEGGPSNTATQPFNNCAFAIEHDMRVVGMNMDGAGARLQADGSDEDMRPLGQPHHLDNCWQQPGTLGLSSSNSRSRVDNSEPTAHHTHWDPKISKLLPQNEYVQPPRDYNNVVVNENSSDLSRMYTQVPDGSGASAARVDSVQAGMWEQEPGAMHTMEQTCDTRPDRHAGQRFEEEGADSTYMYSTKNSLQMHRQHSSQHLYQQTTIDQQQLVLQQQQQQSRALSASLGPSVNGVPHRHDAGSEGGFPDSMLHIPSAYIKFEGPEDNSNLTEERLGRIEAGLGPGVLGNTFIPAAWSGDSDLGGRRSSNPKQQGRASAPQQQWSMNAGLEMNGSSNQQLLNLSGFQQQFSIQQQRSQYGQYSLNGQAMVGTATAETISRLQQQSQQQQHHQRFYSLGAGNIQGNQQPSYPYGNNTEQDNHLHWTAPDNNGSGLADIPSWPNQSPAHAQLQLQGQQAGQMGGPAMNHHNPHQQQTIMQPPRCAILANGQEDHPSNPMSPFSPKSQRMMHSSPSMPAAFPGYHHAQGSQADTLSRAVTSPWLPATAGQYDSLNRVSHNSNTPLTGTPRVTYGSSDGYLDLPTLARVNSWDAIPGVDTLTGLVAQVNPSPTLLERGMSGMLAMEDDPLSNMDRGPRRTTDRDNSVIGGSGEFQHLFDGYDIGADLVVTATAALGNPPNLPPLRTHCAPSPFASQRLYPFAHLNLPEGQTTYPSQNPAQTEELLYSQATHGPSIATTPRQSGLVLDLSVPSQGPDELARASSWHRSSGPNPDSYSPGSGGSAAPIQYANPHRMSLSRGLDTYSPQAYFITERMSMLTHASGDMGAEIPQTLEELAELQHVRNEAYAQSLNLQIHPPVDAGAMPITAGPPDFDQTAAEFGAPQVNSGHLQPLGMFLTVPSADEVPDATGRVYSDNLYGTGTCSMHRTDSDGFDIVSRDNTPRAGASMMENPFDRTPTVSAANQLLAHSHRAVAGRDVRGFATSDLHTTRSSPHTASDRKQAQTTPVPNTLYLPAQHASAGLGYAIPAAATPLLASSSRFKPPLALATSASLPLGYAAISMQPTSMLTASPRKPGYGQNEPLGVFDGVAAERSGSLGDAPMQLARTTSDAAPEDVAAGELQRKSSEGREDVVVRGRRAHGRNGKLGAAVPVKPATAASALAAAAVDQNISHVGGDAGCWVVGSASAGAVASASTHAQPQQHRSATGCGNPSGNGSLSGLAPLYKLKLRGEDSSQGLDAADAEQLLQAASECTELELTQPTGVFRNLAAIRVHSSGLIEQVQAGGRQAFPWTDVGLDSPSQGQSPGSPSLRACKDADVGFGSRNGSPKRAHAVEQGSRLVSSPTKKGRMAVQGTGVGRGASLMMEAGSKAPQVVSRMRPGTADGGRDSVME